MKKEQRLPYLGLSQIALPNGGIPILCSFCRYAHWDGDCSDSYPECHHPLWDNGMALESNFEDVQCGADCWGFRPSVSVEVAADIVGMWLQNLAPDVGAVAHIV